MYTKHTTIYINDTKKNEKNMKECYKRKSHISSNIHVIYISSDNGRHPAANTFTTLHYTTVQIVHQLTPSNQKLKKIAIINMLTVFITRFVNVAYSLHIHYSLSDSTELTGLWLIGWIIGKHSDYWIGMDTEVAVVCDGVLCLTSSPSGPHEYNLEAQCKIFKNYLIYCNLCNL